MSRRRAVGAVAFITGALGLTACGSSPSSSPPTSTTAIAPAAALATGTYAPTGASGTPHYVVKIDSANGAAFRGVMNFVFQDGTSSKVFDFGGTVTGQSATATPTNAAAPGTGPTTVASVPATLQIDVASDALTFTGCQAYLPQVQAADGCTFTLSR